MLLLNMHGAKYSLAWAINNLVSAGQNSKLYPYCLICFRVPWIPCHQKCHSQSWKSKRRPNESKKVHFSCVGLNARELCRGNCTHQFKQLGPVSWCCTARTCSPVRAGAAPGGKQLSEARKQGVRRLTQGSICNWEVLVSDSAVINHPGPILFFDSSVQGLTFNTHDPGPGCAGDRRLQKHQNWAEWHFSPLQ